MRTTDILHKTLALKIDDLLDIVYDSNGYLKINYSKPSSDLILEEGNEPYARDYEV